MSKRIVVQKGDRYGRLTVISDSEGKGSRRKINLSCECGNIVDVALPELRSGDTRSCGCLKSESTSARLHVHGYRHHPAYNSWKNMRRRCKPSFPQSADYFDKGVKVCAEWRDSPVEFCKWAENAGYRKGLELDRKDNDLTGERAYSPENCRWVTHSENNLNTRQSYWWYHKGIRYESGQDAAEASGVTYASVVYRCKSDGFPDTWRELKYNQAA